MAVESPREGVALRPGSHKRIEDLFDGQLRPVSEERPLLLSTHSPWSGFLLERDVCRAGQASTLYYPHTSLVLAASGAIEVRDQALGEKAGFVARPGTVTLWPAGYESRAVSWAPQRTQGPETEMVRVQMDLSVLQRLSPGDGQTTQRPLAPQGGVVDPTLSSLVQLMEAEVAAGCPAGPLFGESLCLALATHVAKHYAAAPVTAPRAAGGLSPRQLARVNDFVQGHLGEALSLVELAAVLGLSPRHFAVAFRQATGITPHQFVLQQRIDAARRLLSGGRQSIADLAASLGFASQSHFTEVFRKKVGTTPTQYRKQR